MWLGQQTGNNTRVAPDHGAALILFYHNTVSVPKNIWRSKKKNTQPSVHTHICKFTRTAIFKCRHSITPSFINSYMHNHIARINTHTQLNKIHSGYVFTHAVTTCQGEDIMATRSRAHAHTPHTHTPQRSSLEASKQGGIERI